MANNTIDLEKYKKLLLDERKRLEEKAHHIDMRDRSASEADELGELSHYDNHPADSATETENRATDLALDEHLNTLIDQIDEAMRKIAEDTYGTCDRCGNPINPERLEAIPYATLCIDCQGIAEQFG